MKPFPKEFDEYILNHEWGTMAKRQHEYFDEVDYLIRFETIEEDMVKLKGLGVPLSKLAKHNSSRHEPWRDYYNDETVEKVRTHFKEDIERFGYEY